MHWTRDQLLAVLRLYLSLPYGKLDSRNAEIKSLAALIGRTPSAVAMKALNFASLDPSITSTGRKGLTGASQADRNLWAEFQTNSESIANESETLHEQLTLQSFSPQTAPTPDPNPHRGEGGRRPDEGPDQPPGTESKPTDRDRETAPDLQPPTGPTEALQLIRARRVQTFFRRAVLVSYDATCAITGLKEPKLLRASHILPWSTHPARRADPTNGLCLNALFDAAFDRGLITIDNDLRVVVSNRLQKNAKEARLPTSLLEAHGQPLLPPRRLPPDRAALNFHQERIFRG
ncbi:hypothetical protein Pan44_52880 [Caulifigura coniformis]|uniref:HNH nuclease domain-containing protein n=1 Tax=Caulifigura coniformis TaxID=2527983 RepID=A0A517SM75_9PLAN|nr:HNH endonuclease [Caulifigura coniformis]QDT57221.1 hypothetical protein Pan44_52880 [Caulifigura coniformis]